MPHPIGFLLRGVKNHMPAKARTSLYAGKSVDIVNRVSRDYEVRSRKFRKPNVVKRRLFSQALGEKVQLKLTTTALRAIDKAGGLDRYLLRTPDSLLFSDVGSDLKFRIGLIYRHKWHEQQQLARQQRQQLRLEPGDAATRAALTGASSSSRGGGGGSPGSSLLPRAAAAALQQQPQQLQLQQQRWHFFHASFFWCCGPQLHIP